MASGKNIITNVDETIKFVLQLLVADSEHKGSSSNKKAFQWDAYCPLINRR